MITEPSPGQHSEPSPNFLTTKLYTQKMITEPSPGQTKLLTQKMITEPSPGQLLNLVERDF